VGQAETEVKMKEHSRKAVLDKIQKLESKIAFHLLMPNGAAAGNLKALDYQ